jgi:hypothetical protein
MRASNRRPQRPGSSNSERPTGFYLQYLNRLIEKRRASGETLPDLHDDEYWEARRKAEQDKTDLKRAA